MAKYKKPRNPTGKGGFQERPQDINLKGAPKRGDTLQDTFKKLANMDRDEAAAYFGEKTDIGRQLKQLSPGIPLKDIVGIRAILTLANDADARLLGTVTDRIEGKPNQPISGGGDPLEVVFKYATTGNPAPSPAPEADDDQGGETP